MTTIDYALMYVTDDSIGDHETFFNILEASLKGGATIIQLREKQSDTLFFYDRAVMAKMLCRDYQVPLIINDRIDIALAVDADGLHIGQKDMPYALARKLVGPHKIIGLSVSNPEQAVEAQNLGVDYIGISPVFYTSTKTKDLDPPLGVEGLKTIRPLFSNPITCIGGIHKKNAMQLMSNGADGIAVVSAISKAENPEKETKELKEIVCQTGLRK